MTAGMAIQRTVERIDSVPIGVWAGLGVLAGWAVAAPLGAFVLITGGTPDSRPVRIHR